MGWMIGVSTVRIFLCAIMTRLTQDTQPPTQLGYQGYFHALTFSGKRPTHLGPFMSSYLKTEGESNHRNVLNNRGMDDVEKVSSWFLIWRFLTQTLVNLTKDVRLHDVRGVIIPCFVSLHYILIDTSWNLSFLSALKYAPLKATSEFGILVNRDLFDNWTAGPLKMFLFW
jgi:hypothetical protein